MADKVDSVANKVYTFGMNIDLKKIHEDYQHELKESQDKIPANIYETYSSFANTLGGTIYLGIREKKEENIIVGVKDPAKIRKDFFNTLNNKEKVSDNILRNDDFQIFSYEEKNVIVIHVPKADISQKPIYLDGNIKNSFKRDDEGDHYCTYNEILAMQMDASHVNYDQRPNSQGITYDMLTGESLKQYRNYFNQVHKDNIFEKLSDIAFFRMIGALKENKEGREVATNGAVALFGNSVQIKYIYPCYFLEYRESQEGDARWNFRIDSDDLTWSGNIFDFFMRVSKRLPNVLPNKFKLQGVVNVSGNDEVEAAREAILNAIFNASFFRSGGVTVRYDGTTLSVTNPGGPMVPINQMIHGGESNPRNEGIMTLMRQLGWGEKAGQGIPKIFSIFRSLNYPEPIYVENGNPESLTLRLNYSSLKIETKDVLTQKILGLFSTGKELGSEEVAKSLNLSVSLIRKRLNELVKDNILIDNGFKTKGRKYKLPV